jgi:hypothetical protein
MTNGTDVDGCLTRNLSATEQNIGIAKIEEKTRKKSNSTSNKTKA